jgi:uncharacterized coiled-coil DUF342 family protein
MSAEMNIEASFKVIQGDLEDMKASMSRMADALTKIAILEEKHQVMAQTMLKITEKIDALTDKHNALHVEQVKQQTTLKVSMKAIQVAWGVIGSGLLYGAWQVVKLIGGHGA